jgi:hypothetical protein
MNKTLNWFKFLIFGAMFFSVAAFASLTREKIFAIGWSIPPLQNFPRWSQTPYQMQSAVYAIPDVFNQSSGTLSYSNGPLHGGGSFFGGVAAEDGLIVLVPHDSLVIRSFIVSLEVMGPSSSHTTNSVGAFAGGVLIPDGRIIFAPHNSEFVGIYVSSPGIYSNGPAIQ